MKLEFEETSCCICGSCARTTWLTGLKDRWFAREETFTLVRCAGCGHIYQNPRPTAKSLHLCYPQDYEPYHGMRNPVVAFLKRLVLTKEVRECLHRKRPPATVLEIGCAHGEFLEALQGAGFQTRGVEFDPEAARRAQERGLDVLAGTLREAALADGFADIAYMKQVIEHLPDVPETLTEIHRILKPGGWLLVATPNVDCPLVRRFGGDTFDLEIPRHLNLFSVATLRQQLERCRFAVERVCHDPVPNSWIKSLRLRLERRPWARAFFRLENPLALACLSPVSGILALAGRSSRIRVWARRTD